MPNTSHGGHPSESRSHWGTSIDHNTTWWNISWEPVAPGANQRLLGGAGAQQAAATLAPRWALWRSISKFRLWLHNLTSLSFSLAPSIFLYPVNRYYRNSKTKSDPNSPKESSPRAKMKHQKWSMCWILLFSKHEFAEPANFQCYPFNLHFLPMSCETLSMDFQNLSFTNSPVNSSFRSQPRRFWSGHSWLVNLGILMEPLELQGHHFGSPFCFESTIHSISQHNIQWLIQIHDSETFH